MENEEEIKTHFWELKQARALTNEKNIEKLFDNDPTVSYSLPYTDHDDGSLGYQIWSAELKGSYKTPDFRNIPGNPPYIHFTLLLPLVVMKKADNARLEMELVVHVQNNGKWQVQYREGGKYLVYTSPYKQKKHWKSWQQAKNFCKDRNSTLATVQSIGELVEFGITEFQCISWIGASDIEQEDVCVWAWLDGTPWSLRLKPFVPV